MLSVLVGVLAQVNPFADWPQSQKVEPVLAETALSNVTKLTFGGDNAEAYWDITGTMITWQARLPGFPDEQIFTMNADGSGKKLVSVGKGRTTCSYFSPDREWVYFSSTHLTNEGAQKPVDMSKGYVWMVNPEFKMFRAKPDGSQLTPVLDLPGYLAETTIAPDNSYMTFTSDYQGDLEIYRSDVTGRNLMRLTNEDGYDGGPFVSWDGAKIVYRRAPSFKTQADRKEYQELLSQHLVRPSRMDVWIMNNDGSGKKQVTNLPGASFAPFLHPNNRQIIFCSNYADPKGREFDLYVIDIDGTNLRQLTFSEGFDGFPMVSKDGKKLIFASNRYGKTPRETNLYTADLNL